MKKGLYFSIYKYAIIKWQMLQLNYKIFLHLIKIFKSMLGYFIIKKLYF